MPFHKLPPELLYVILSNLAEEDLRSCALTCRALIKPAQAGLFRTISPLYYESTVETVLRKFESTPHLAAYIRHLKLFEIHKPWIQDSKVLPKLLALLSPATFQTLHIHHRRRELHSRFQFSSLSRLDFLTDISLAEEDPKYSNWSVCGDDALPEFLNQFPKLRAITFEQCLVGNITASRENGFNPPDLEISPPIFKLEKLNVVCCEDTLTLEWLIPALSYLKTLCITHPRGPCASISNTIFPKYIAAAGQALQHLEVNLIDASDDVGLKLLTSALQTHATNLRSFNMTVKSIGQAVQVLPLIGTHARLEHLIISIYPCDGIVEDSPWDELQDLLLSENRFSALRCFELCFLANSEESIPNPSDPIFAAVPGLAQKKIFSLTMMGYHT
ncbi:hypothetical protein H0H92_006034 [Tricholoma furcatifolium]|nr:hypothetical protein H0H92_006034 [Tricholoma furcatifolium]